MKNAFRMVRLVAVLFVLTSAHPASAELVLAFSGTTEQRLDRTSSPNWVKVRPLGSFYKNQPQATSYRVMGSSRSESTLTLPGSLARSWRPPLIRVSMLKIIKKQQRPDSLGSTQTRIRLPFLQAPFVWGLSSINPRRTGRACLPWATVSSVAGSAMQVG